MKGKILAIVLGTCVIFVWNAFSWMVIAWHPLKNIPQTAIDPKFLQSNMQEPGVYHYPGVPETNNQTEWEVFAAKSEKGPIISMLVYSPKGRPLFSPITFISGLLFNCLTVVLVVFLVAKVRIKKYLHNVLFIASLGLFASLASDVPQGLWFDIPFPFMASMIGDIIVAWTLAGFVIARFVKTED